MAESTTATLQLWETALPGVATQAAAPALPDLVALVHGEALGPASALVRGQGSEPFSLQWFLDLENLRHNRYARWLPNALEYTKHAGETVLGWGIGLGSDWVQYARQGASVVACCPCPQHLTYVRRNFDLRGIPARFLQARGNLLPVETASVDVVCLNALHAAHPVTPELIAEVYRTLRPGGKVLGLVPAYFNIEFWQRWLLPWQRLYAPGGTAAPPAFTARQLRLAFGRFSEHRVHKRHLRRVDIPHVWRVLPIPVLERLVGQVLVLKAFKPLSVVLPPVSAAA